MDELVRWLGEQLDTDERHSVLWHSFECHLHVDIEEGGRSAQAAMELLRSVPGAVCSCGLPARVLREIEAKRKLLDAYAEVAANDIDEPYEYAYGWANGLGHAVRLLATAYADRPGYREEWRP